MHLINLFTLRGCRVSIHGQTHNSYGPCQVHSMLCEFGIETLFFRHCLVSKRKHIYIYIFILNIGDQNMMFVFASKRTQATQFNSKFDSIDWANLKTFLKNKLNYDKVTFNTIKWSWKSHVTQIHYFVHGEAQYGPLQCLRVNFNIGPILTHLAKLWKYVKVDLLRS